MQSLRKFCSNPFELSIILHGMSSVHNSRYIDILQGIRYTKYVCSRFMFGLVLQFRSRKNKSYDIIGQLIKVEFFKIVSPLTI